jgi:hypothetical protein
VLSAVIVALYPALIAFSHYLWAENLFSALLLLALAIALRGERSRSLGWPALAGLAFGLATLCRELAIVVAVAFAAWRVMNSPPADRRRVMAGAALMLLVCVVVVLPWTLRNYRMFDRIVPVSTVGPFALREGNTFEGQDWIAPPMESLREFRRDYYAISSEMGRLDFALAQSIDLIRAEQPGWLLRKLTRATTLLLAPDSFLFKKISRGSYGKVDLGLARPILLLTLGAYLFVVTFAIVGIAISKGEGRRLLACLIIGAVFMVHVLSNASSRFRLPFIPLLAIYAAHLITSRGSVAERFGRPELAACAGFLLLLFFWCVPFFVPEVISLWSTGAYLDPQRQ